MDKTASVLRDILPTNTKGIVRKSSFDDTDKGFPALPIISE